MGRALNAEGILGIRNVKDYGAKGDGTGDDQPAIQAAINEASAADGGIVYFPPGTYPCASTLLIPSNSVLEGAGVASVIKVNPGVGAQNLLENSDQENGNTGIAIRNLKIEGSLTAGRDGISLQACDESIIENVEVTTCNSKGITIGNGCQRVLVLGCYVHGNGTEGIELMGAAQCVIAGCRVLDNGTITASAGVRLSFTSTDNEIVGLISRDSRSTGSKTQTFGVEIDSTSVRNVVTGLNAEGNRDGRISDASASSVWNDPIKAEATLDFSQPGAVPSSVDLTLTVNGAQLGDPVTVAAPVAVGTNYLLTGFVSAPNTVTIRWTQIAGAAADPDGAGGTYRVLVWRRA